MADVPAIHKRHAKPPDRSERLIWMATGLLGVFFAFLAFRAVPSFEQDLGRLGQTEARALAAWRAIATELNAGKLTNEKAADRIEREVLPVWRDARGQLARLKTGPWPDRLAPQIPEAFRLREEAWTAMIAAIRTDDSAQADRAEAAWVEADRLVAELRQTAVKSNGPTPRR